jgi:hypothetical protein
LNLAPGASSSSRQLWLKKHVTSPCVALTVFSASSSALVVAAALGEAEGPSSPEPARSSAVRLLAGMQRKSSAASARALSGSAPATSAVIAAASSSSLPWRPSRPSHRCSRPRFWGVARREHARKRAPTAMMAGTFGE